MCHLIDVLADFVKLLRVEDFPVWLIQGEPAGHINTQGSLDQTTDIEINCYWNICRTLLLGWATYIYEQLAQDSVGLLK